MGWEVGRRFKREWTDVCLWLIHVDVWQKPTQNCKEIILQLKIYKLMFLQRKLLKYLHSHECRVKTLLGSEKYPRWRASYIALMRTQREGWKVGQSRWWWSKVLHSFAGRNYAIGFLPLGRPDDSCAEKTLSFYRGRKENGIICSTINIWDFLSLQRT